MRRLLAATSALTLLSTIAFAQPAPPRPQPPQVLWGQAGNWSATQIFNSTSGGNFNYPNVGMGTASNPVMVYDPTGEVYINSVFSKVQLTTGDNNKEMLAFISQFYIDPTIYNYGQNSHNSAGYFFAHGANKLALANCTQGVNCPGSIYAITGLVAGASNDGTGPARNAYTFVIHAPDVPPTGGSLDYWTGIVFQTPLGGKEASAFAGITTANDVPNGFGTINPMANVHARVINSTGTATATINGNVLTLMSRPTNPYGITPACDVSGAGVSAGSKVYGSQPSDGSYPMLNVTPSQTLATPTLLTFNCNPYPLIIQSFYNADLNFISQSGGNVPNATISARFDANSSHLHFLLGGTTSVVMGKNTSGGRIGIGNLDTYPNFTVDAGGVVAAWGPVSQGPRFTTDGGCAEGSRAGGASAGRFVVAASAQCSVVVTMAGGAAQNAAITEWGHCGINNRTHPGAANAFALTAATATTATFSGVPVSGDTLDFACTGF